MSADRDVNRIVRSWLEEGVTTLPDRVLDGVLDQVPATPQRRSWWPARRASEMNNIARLAIAAAAVVVVAIAGYNLLPGGSGPGGLPTPTPTLTQTPTPTETPTPTQMPVPTPIALKDGSLEAGAYVAHPFPAPNDSIAFTFNVPEGWQGAGTAAVIPTAGTAGPTGAAMAFIQVTGLFSDPCHGNQAGAPTVPVGTTVDELVGAFAGQTAYDVTPATDVTLGGYSGKQIDLQLPSDVDFAACDDGAFWVWDGPPYAQGPGNRWHLLILDVEGVRVVILAQDFATTSVEVQAELRAIVDSIRIEL
jgi:hypothetical protein